MHVNNVGYVATALMYVGHRMGSLWCLTFCATDRIHTMVTVGSEFGSEYLDDYGMVLVICLSLAECRKLEKFTVSAMVWYYCTLLKYEISTTTTDRP